MLRPSFGWMFKSKLRLFKHSFSKLEWEACKHNLSIGMQQSMTNHLGMRGWIYRKVEGVRDPQKREEGPHLKGKVHDGKIKRSKWESSTISTKINIHLVVPEGSSEWSFSSCLGKPARRRRAQAFLWKPVLAMWMSNWATCHQHGQVVEKNALMPKIRF